MLEKDLIRDIKGRLKTMVGQLDGIVKMLDSDRDPEEILNQFKAVSAALESAQFLLLDETFRKALAIKISEAIEACPGNCGQEDKIELLRKQFPNLALSEITYKMKEIQKTFKSMDKSKKTDDA